LDNTLIFFLQDNGACAEPTGRNFAKNRKLHPDGPRAEKPSFPPQPPEALVKAMVKGQTRDGYPIRQGPNVMPGPADTFIAYGRGWANVSNTPFREYKHWVHEGGISTPLIAHWPKGIAARGELRQNPGHVIDLVPTILEATGARRFEEWEDRPVPSPPGKSLVPAFARDDTVRHDDLWWEHEGNRALRRGDWKVVAAGRDGPWELYDLAADRTETLDLAGQHPQKVQELVRRWEALRDEFYQLARRDLKPGKKEP
jgi:arylsulfatase A-like enzyme